MLNMPISVQTLPFDDEHSSCQSAHQDSLPTCSPAQVQAHTVTHVNVFLGSLTFTSEQLASSLAEKAKQQGAVVSIQSLEEFKSEQYLDVNSSCRAPSRVAVFVVSTHAAGKPSPNAERFLLWLRTTSDLNRTVTKDHKTQEDAYVTRTNTPYAPATDTSTVFTPSPRKRQTSLSQAIIDVPTHPPGTRPGFRLTWRLPFSGVDSSKSECKSIGPLKSFQYAVFGVGNSIYRTYNSTAKYIDTTLEQLGATRICSLGLGDISKNIDAVFTSWESQFLQAISKPIHVSSIFPLATAREAPRPPPRASLPFVTTKVEIGHFGAIEEHTTTRGPTTADLEICCAKSSHPHGDSSRPRRHSSASTMILARRGSFDTITPTSFMPPLAKQ